MPQITPVEPPEARRVEYASAVHEPKREGAHDRGLEDVTAARWSARCDQRHARATATPFLLSRFTAYIAASAARKSPSASAAWSGNVATPTLAVTREMSTSVCGSLVAAAIAARIASAMRAAA